MQDFPQIRMLSASDEPAFTRLRMALFAELGEASGRESGLSDATRRYFLAETGKTLLSWGVFAKGGLAACASVCIFQRLPYAGNLTGKEGYLLNVYTLPAFRRQGFASALLKQILAEAPTHGIGRLWLNASEEGRPLYGAHGFREVGDVMEWYPADFA